RADAARAVARLQLSVRANARGARRHRARRRRPALRLQAALRQPGDRAIADADDRHLRAAAARALRDAAVSQQRLDGARLPRRRRAGDDRRALVRFRPARRLRHAVMAAVVDRRVRRDDRLQLLRSSGAAGARPLARRAPVNAAARDPVIVAGAGIGGLAAALALAQRGFRVAVLEQAAEIGEIGAGVQLAPNAFAAFDALGVGERARSRAVYTDRMVMMDAVDETLVGEIPTGPE